MYLSIIYQQTNDLQQANFRDMSEIMLSKYLASSQNVLSGGNSL